MRAVSAFLDTTRFEASFQYARSTQKTLTIITLEFITLEFITLEFITLEFITSKRHYPADNDDRLLACCKGNHWDGWMGSCLVGPLPSAWQILQHGDAVEAVQTGIHMNASRLLNASIDDDHRKSLG
jgi:hypothetical protein